MEGPLLGSQVASRLVFQRFVIGIELSFRILEGTVAFQIGGYVPDGDGERVIGKIRKGVPEGSRRHLEPAERPQETGSLLRSGGCPFQEEVLVVGRGQLESRPVGQGADEVRVLADPGRGPGLEQLRGLAGRQEGHGGPADAACQFLQARRLEDADSLVQMAAGGIEERLGPGSQEEPVLIGRLEAGFRGQGLIGREEGGIGGCDFRRDERDERAAVMQGYQHPVLPRLGQIGHQPSKQNTAAASAGTARRSGYSVLTDACRGLSSRYRRLTAQAMPASISAIATIAMIVPFLFMLHLRRKLRQNMQS